MTSPRVFISYARKDGEAFATALRERLERDEPEVTLWQDRARMEGGVGWWKQITGALDQVQFMVLVVTPGSLASDVVQKEWRYARQQGVCIYPVNGSPGKQLDFGSMPRWMSGAHFYNLDHEWQTFVNYLKSPCHAARIPFMAPDLPTNFVGRPAPFDQLLGCVLDAGRVNPIPTTVALHGAGGFGKTTLATQLCHHEDVITAYADGVLWVTLGEKPSVLAELTKLYAALTGERPEFVNQDDAAIELALKLAERRCLIVIDDVWDRAHLASFLRGKDQCTRLITTRLFNVAVDEAARRVGVDEMTTAEAAALLAGYLDAPPPDVRPLETLAQRLGEWPLLLELTGATLRQRIARGDTLDGALAYINRALDEEGAVAFDRRNAQERRQAVVSTIAVSLDLLSDEERRRYRALAVFPEDVDVPLGAVGTLLGLNAFKTEKLVQVLADLSLLKLDLRIGTLRLHDIMRAYLAAGLEDASVWHARLADAWVTPGKLTHAYAWRYAAYHMAEALSGADPQEERHRRTKRLVELVTDPAFKEGHLSNAADPPALEQDLERALRRAVEDDHAEAPELVVRSALALTAFDGHQPARLFDLAREGKLEKAEPLLALFDPEESWRQAALLTLAWQSAAAGHDAQARALLARLERQISKSDSVLAPLLGRVRSATEQGVTPPPSHLPGAPDPFTVSQILARLGGTALTPIEPLMIPGLQRMGDDAPAYMAEQDGPLLVAFAQADPEHNTSYLKQYIGLQASNAYSYYRNRSLRALIPAVVQHERPAWVLDVLRDLVASALTPPRIDFRSALSLTLRGLCARGGDAAALQALEDDRESTIELVRNLSPERGKGDPWAHCLRRLAALAEVYARVLDRAAEAHQLLNEALDVDFQYSFAGYRAPACLTLAESLRVCGRDHDQGIGKALDFALAAAHNVQEAQFCAQMTARVNAMQARWWPTPLGKMDVASTVEQFTLNPQGEAFATLHRIGAAYERRIDLPTKLHLPAEMRAARTFQEIKQLYTSLRSAADEDVLALNPGLLAPIDQPLPEGSSVNISDPDFMPLLAARMSAEVLAADNFSQTQRTAFMQRLMPLSAANRTALDTVAARLLMAALPQDPATLRSLVAATAEG